MFSSSSSIVCITTTIITVTNTGRPSIDLLQSLAHLLCEMRDVNKSLQFEVDDLKQKLTDAQGIESVDEKN